MSQPAIGVAEVVLHIDDQAGRFGQVDRELLGVALKLTRRGGKGGRLKLACWALTCQALGGVPSVCKLLMLGLTVGIAAAPLLMDPDRKIQCKYLAQVNAKRSAPVGALP